MENSFEKKVVHLIDEYRMIEEQDCVIVGVSGGADSVCLLFVLYRLSRERKFGLMAAHVEHGIRGKESLEDAAFVEELCRKLDVPLRIRHADVRGMARQEKISTEEAGRRIRYGFFREIAGECASGIHGRVHIAVAHNADDQAETILWNMVRGSGIKGLCGMRPVRDGIIRPLLECTRAEIEAYLRGQGAVWRTDATNLETDYTRNRLRLKVLPVLEKECNHQAARHIVMAGGKLAKAQDYLERQADKALKACMASERAGKVSLDAALFCSEEEILQEYMLRAAIERTGAGLKNVTSGHIDDIRKLAASCGRKSLSLPGNLTAQLQGGRLSLINAELSPDMAADGEDSLIFVNIEKKYDILIPSCIKIGNIAVKFSLEPWKKQLIPENKYTKWFDYDTIRNKLQVRNRLPGDCLSVTKDGGHKKLKDYFIDEKVPHEKRGQVLLLAEGSQILWAVGYRISEAYKISERTKTVLKVQVMEEF